MGITDRQEVRVRTRKGIVTRTESPTHCGAGGFCINPRVKGHPIPRAPHRFRPRRQAETSSCVCCQLDESRHQRRAAGIISIKHLPWTRPDRTRRGRGGAADYSSGISVSRCWSTRQPSVTKPTPSRTSDCFSPCLVLGFHSNPLSECLAVGLSGLLWLRWETLFWFCLNFVAH